MRLVQEPHAITFMAIPEMEFRELMNIKDFWKFWKAGRNCQLPQFAHTVILIDRNCHLPHYALRQFYLLAATLSATSHTYIYTITLATYVYIYTYWQEQSWSHYTKHSYALLQDLAANCLHYIHRKLHLLPRMICSPCTCLHLHLLAQLLLFFAL